MADQKQPAGRNVPIRIEEDVADGVYANLAFIASNTTEFIFDFARFLPGNSRGKVVSRVVLGPVQAKSFLNSLEEAIGGYEEKFGSIDAKKAAGNIGFKINNPAKEEEE